jgi:DnaJ-class molecular chaperone
LVYQQQYINAAMAQTPIAEVLRHFASMSEELPSDVTDSAKEDHYGELGVTPAATADEIKAAYRSKAREHHPDKTGGTQSEEFIRVASAYEVLSDPRRREVYDQQITTERNGNTVKLSVPLGDVYTDTWRTIRYERRHGAETRTVVRQICIPAGVQDYERLVFSETDALDNLIVIVRIVNRNKYRISGNDVICDVVLTLRQALCGEPFNVTRPDGHTLTLRAPGMATVGNETWWRSPGHGLPSRGANPTGDMCVRVSVHFPPSVSSNAREVLCNVLPRDSIIAEGIESSLLPATSPVNDTNYSETPCTMQ